MRVLVSLALCVSVFGAGFFPAPVFGSSDNVLQQVSETELVEAIGQGLTLRKIDGFSRVGQHTSVVGWSDSLGYELNGGGVDFNLHLYEAQPEQKPNELFAQVLAELQPTMVGGLIFPLAPEEAYGARGSYEVAVLFRDRDTGEATGSIFRWIPAGQNLLLVEVTKTATNEGLLPDPEEYDKVLLPVVRLITEKMLGKYDPSAQSV